MYQHGASSVKCSSCSVVTEIGVCELHSFKFQLYSSLYVLNLLFLITFITIIEIPLQALISNCG